MCGHLAKFLWGPLGFEEMGWGGEWGVGVGKVFSKGFGRHLCSS